MNVPHGWKLVPVEPTPEMLAATSWPKCAGSDYQHMLSAAPIPPAQQDDEALQIISDLIADLERVGSDGWMTGQVHSDEYNAARAFLAKRGAA